MADAGPLGLDLRTSGHMLRRWWSLLLASLPALLLAALLLLSFRSALFAGTLRVAAVADRDPAVRSLLSRLSPGSAATAAAGPLLRPPPRRRSPFLQLTRLGTFDDDFFSDSDAAAAGDRHFPRWPASSNASFPFPVRLFLVDGALGSSSSPKSLKIRVPEFPSPSSSPSAMLKAELMMPLAIETKPSISGSSARDSNWTAKMQL